jgi:hypothetical protein
MRRLNARRHGAGLLAAVVMAGGLWLSGCARTPPEAAIGEAVEAIDTALDAQDNAGVRRWLAEDFRGGPAGTADPLDKAGVQRLLAGYFLRYRHIGVVVSGLTVTPLAHDDTQAWSEAKVLLTGAEGLIPDTGRLYTVRGLWQRDGDDWALRELTWE